MDVTELFLSCRRGDLWKVKFLVEQKELDLNLRDKWDSTPLYYACLCGHDELVEYLLQNGAKCEANTFDGERCMYGALSNEIRNLLRSFNAISSKTMRRDLYEEFLRRLQESGMYADIVFDVHGERYPSHRCILCARSDYFAQMFQTKWKGRREIHIKHNRVMPFAFKRILQYLYSGHLEIHIDNVEDCTRLAKQCRLDGLMQQLQDGVTRTLSFESTKPGVNVTMLCIEPAMGSVDVQLDLGKLADLALPPELCSWMHSELPFEPEESPVFPDICFSVQGHKFLCHKAFFCGRSDYFKVLLLDHFGETDTTDGMLVVTIHEVSAEVFTQVMYYVYQGFCELSSSIAYDVLCAADMYLLPGLKRQCAACIEKCLEMDNVIRIIKTARLFNLPRLEGQCAEFLANHIDKAIGRDDFSELVQEDASEVKSRHETDTIAIIDDIRFYITNFVQTFSDLEEANQKLQIIDNLLENLELDA